MARPIRQQGEKRQLGPPIAFPKGVDGVQVRQKMRPAGGKILARQALQLPIAPQFLKHPHHFRGDVLGIAEHAGALSNAHGPVFAGPGVDVLEQMPVQGTVMGRAQVAGRERLFGPLQHGLMLKAVEFVLVLKIGAVLENRRSGVAVGGRTALVHAPSTPSWRTF